MSVEAINTKSNISNINNNARIAPPPETPLKSEEKSNGKALLWGSLAALAIGGGIYLATRGRGNVPSGSISKTGTSTQQTTKKLDQIIKKDWELVDFNPENKKFLDKIEERLKQDLETLKNLESGKYVKKDGKFVLAEENEQPLFELIRKSKGKCINRIITFDKAGNLKREIAFKKDGTVTFYHSRNGRAVVRCLDHSHPVVKNGKVVNIPYAEYCASTDLSKSKNSATLNLARHGKEFFYSTY